MACSVLIPIYRRPADSLNPVINAWAKQVDHVLIWANDYPYNQIARLDLPYNSILIDSEHNYGGQVKFKAVGLLPTEYVFVADDDILIQPGLVDTFERLLVQDDTVYSVWGRVITKGLPYRNHPLLRGDQIHAAWGVDFVGRLYYGHISNFLLPMYGCTDTRLDDLYWSLQLKKFGRRMCVIPCDKWVNTTRANDEYSISRMDGFWACRDKFISEEWVEE